MTFGEKLKEARKEAGLSQEQLSEKMSVSRSAKLPIALENMTQNQTQINTIALARHNEKNVVGIVINAFSEPFVVNKELFELIEGMESSLNAD